MTAFLFYGNVVLVLAILAEGLARRAGYLEVPFLCACIFALWYLPQVQPLLAESALPIEGLATLLFMSLLCLAAMWLGWRLRVPRADLGRPIELPLAQLAWPVAAITLFAAAMRGLIVLQPDEARAMAQWSGPLTILYFFSQVNVVSLVASLSMVLAKRTVVTIALAGANVMLYAPMIFIYFRRAEIFEFAFAAVAALYFVRGRTIPRLVVVGGIVSAFFLLHAVGELRALGGGYALDAGGRLASGVPTLEEVMSVDWLAAVDKDGDPLRSEAHNAAIYIAAVSASGTFAFGAELWNFLVAAYVPGQIVGHELKNSLIVGESLAEISLFRFGYEPVLGTTATGFPHVYRDLGYVGCLVFLFLALWMARLYRMAARGHFVFFVMYAASLTLVIHSMTHYGYYYLVNAPIVLLPSFFVLRLRLGKGQSGRPRGPAPLRAGA